MRRADRLFQIVQYLRGGRLTTARVLAGTLEVSERTIYRDIADLQGSGVPIEGEAGVGYIMRAGYDLPPLMFTREEVMAVVAGARMVRSWGGTRMAMAAEEALVKIRAVLPEELQAGADRVEVQAYTVFDLTGEERAAIDTVEAAIDARLRLSFAYEDAEGAATVRTIRPLSLVFWGKVWTVIAWCELREDFRMFRIDRMTNIDTGVRFRAERDKSLTAFYASESYRGRPAGGSQISLQR